MSYIDDDLVLADAPGFDSLDRRRFDRRIACPAPAGEFGSIVHSGAADAAAEGLIDRCQLCGRVEELVLAPRGFLTCGACGFAGEARQ